MSISIQLANQVFEVQNFNNHFLLLKSEEALGLASIGKAILSQDFAFIDEVIAAEQEIYLQLNANFEENDIQKLADLELENEQTIRNLQMPILFGDTDDWEAIEVYTGLSKNSCVEQLQSISFTISMFGFLPGFVYFNGLPKHLQVPRKATPAQRIPPNSLALGGPYLGIYSLPSPGGWQVIGSLALPVLQWEYLPPVVLEPNDNVRLQAVNRSDFLHIQHHTKSLLEYNGIS